MTEHKITATRSGFTNGMDWEASYEITFEHRRHSPGVHAYGVMNREPDEVEAVDIKSEFGALTGREKTEALDWAQMWLDDEGYDAAIAKAAGSPTSSPDGEAGGTTPSGGNNT